jgi:hypothetical protein
MVDNDEEQLKIFLIPLSEINNRSFRKKEEILRKRKN